MQKEIVTPVDHPVSPSVAVPTATTSPGRPPISPARPPTSPSRPPITYFIVPSQTPPPSKTHFFFDKFQNHEAQFRAAITTSPKYHATAGPRRTKLLRPLPPPIPKVETVTVDTQTVWATFKAAETQTESQEPLTRADFRLDLKAELQFWLGFLVHLH
jgi:hypothetical protein